MELQFIDLGKLSVSKANMRYAKKAPDVSDILPTVRARGVIMPLIVRPSGEAGAFEIVAGARRFHAALIVAEERRGAEGEGGREIEPLPCAIIAPGDDAAAIEVSLIENIARLDPDEVTQWECFTRLVREGRDPADIAATFGLPDLAVKRVLALGNLLPRVRSLYRDGEIDRATVRHLTMASKKQQQAWLELHNDPQAYCPTGHQLKSWLLGGQTVPVRHALFETAGMGGIVADLFGEDAYFADADAFWALQNAAIETKRAGYIEAGWSDVVVVPPSDHFHSWEHEKAGKRKGGRVYLDVRANGEVIVHEGYVTRLEARRIDKGLGLESGAKPSRGEVTSTLGTYIDLHRHAACRAALLGHPGLALRLMVAHAIAGSPLWTVRIEPQSAKTDAVRESVELSAGEALFDHARLKVLRLLRQSEEEPTAAGGNGDPFGLVGIFLRLVPLTDTEVFDIAAVAMGETLMAGSAAVDAVGSEIGLDMADYWQADDAFFDLLRDREVLGALVGEVAGPLVAEANAPEKGKTLKQIVRDHLEGVGGRTKVEGWVPRWMAFPPTAYTQRGGVGSVGAHALVMAARASLEPDTRPDDDGTLTAQVPQVTEPDETHPLAA
ncbi:ParB/RepB/Spo0J family partition protein [Novosphingobium sp. G106]|uniref:ParB/RepB/Spo0J family partition protein n=1 Tax=Novosphingobium sp. G106 TaxID=2849500 RepID=UPI001C2D5862|nr:ParB/RepB/Spo0J family partition protein [Novosphingobium sp. G106]MBV1688990.1 ParB/RepB/Spo0J family partition protein [Novosphingobium sp. G106]